MNILEKQLINDNSKPWETGGRKATGPVKWQPAIERLVFLFPFQLSTACETIKANPGKPGDAKL